MAGLCKSMILLLVTDHILFDYLCQIWPMLMVTAAGWVYVSSDQPWLRSTLPWENGAFQFLSSLSWIWAFKIFLMLYVDMDTVVVMLLLWCHLHPPHLLCNVCRWMYQGGWGQSIICVIETNRSWIMDNFISFIELQITNTAKNWFDRGLVVVYLWDLH